MRRGPRAFTALLAVTFAGLSGYAVAASRHQAELIRVVAEAGSDTNAYERAAYLVTRETELLQAAMREPDGEERDLLLAANQQADDATQRMAEIDQEHVGTAARLADQHHRIAPILTDFLAQLDQKDHDAAFTTLETILEPEYDSMITALIGEQDQHLAEYDRLQAAAVRESDRSALTVLVVFLLGLVILLGYRLSSRAYRRQLDRMAATDPLTGLLNRNAFTTRVQRFLGAGRGTTVLVLNVDGFREVNEQLGQSIGDLMLIEIGKRLVASTRENDAVARLGGDEFAILLDDGDLTTGESIAARLSGAFTRAFEFDEITLDLEVSIGAAVAVDGDDATTVLRHADTAMHIAKQLHADYHCYRDDRRHDAVARLTLLGDLRRALDDPGQLTLHYQPQIAVNGGDLAGVEALARWQHPTRGPVSPAEFIPVLEVSSLMHRFTEQMLGKALRQGRTWLDAGHRVPISVNVSTRSLLDPGFPQRVAALLDETGVPGTLLCIEVTEYALMSDPETAIEALRQLRDLGVNASIDDYGTGFSSMTYLKLLPVGELKVDQSFVKDVATDSSSRALVASTVELGHSLGLTVVAEGVEDDGALSILRAIGCDVAQGYHFARPMPADEMTARLEEGRQPSPVTAAG
ncbi:putative bifunctional diguanylate cyclase/phosphodiesterase [Paractinoplanes durhamensis]|uniref:putative bifunctional diguanylate cyclase/phosphodiesterase n=1 Tax=Paractinoplanes durhamensis TaxID=113563 RepID=UPI00194046D2|nr:bifunctional diguanylate cyclase/phosphodiesterase [Actinoplanes durhamensis]